MSRKGELEFATFICKFGTKDLLDGLEEVVIPAFRDGYRRRYGKTTYLIHKPELIRIHDDFCIVFEFVKDTVLEREQLVDDLTGDLVESSGSLDTAPSAICLLICNTHRLVYLPKTKYPPDLKEFEQTCKSIFVQRWQRWTVEHTDGLSRRKKSELRKAREAHLPRPSIAVLPLSSAESIDLSLQSFSKVRKLTLTLLETNNEYDPTPFFEDMRNVHRALGAKKTTVQHSNPDGMDKDQVATDLKAATEQGTSRVRVEGLGADGSAIKQQNEDLKLKVPADFEPGEPAAVAEKMRNALLEQERRGTVKRPGVVTNISNRLSAVYEKLKAPR